MTTTMTLPTLPMSRAPQKHRRRRPQDPAPRPSCAHRRQVSSSAREPAARRHLQVPRPTTPPRLNTTAPPASSLSRPAPRQAIALADWCSTFRASSSPSDAPPVKRIATEGYGGEVILYDRDNEDREAIDSAARSERG